MTNAPGVFIRHSSFLFRIVRRSLFTGATRDAEAGISETEQLESGTLKEVRASFLLFHFAVGAPLERFNDLSLGTDLDFAFLFASHKFSFVHISGSG